MLLNAFLIPGLKQLFKLLGFSIFKPKETKFFMDIVQATLRDRLNSNDGSPRNDLIDLMIKAMKDEDDAGNTNDDDDANKEQFDLDAELQNRKKIKRKELDELTIMGTAMLMLVVGNLNQ